jgi:hypothetical protein
MSQLAEEADAMVLCPLDSDVDGVRRMRAALESALAAEYPAVARAARDAAAAGYGKKAVVAAAVGTMLDFDDPAVQEVLQALASCQSWAMARTLLGRMGFAGELISRPQRRGLRLPCAPHASPSDWGTNWGLPNVSAVAAILLRRCEPQPTCGNGWECHRV